jgi:hypothetical protein
VGLCYVYSLADARQLQAMLDMVDIPFFIGREKATTADAVTSNFADVPCHPERSEIFRLRKITRSRRTPCPLALCKGLAGSSLQLGENASRSLGLRRQTRGPSTPAINSQANQLPALRMTVLGCSQRAAPEATCAKLLSSPLFTSIPLNRLIQFRI